MSWTFFSGITKQVTRYSSIVGQLWYVLTFIFRLIIVATLGGAVYGDEQAKFICNDKSAGCNNACYNQFTTISHLKFWAFQLMSVTAPVVAFHFFATYLAGELEKIKKTEAALEDEDAFDNQYHRQHEENKMRHRKKVVGKMKTKRVFNGSKLEEIPMNDKLRFAYFLCTVLRLVAEAVFLYLTSTLYNYQTPKEDCTTEYALTHDDIHKCFTNGTGLDFLWAEFPEFYRCAKQPGASIGTSGVKIACFQNLAFGGYVPCWTSRAWEKTVFLRYMNVMSAICFCLCAIEIFVVPLQYLHHKSAKNKIRIVYGDYPDSNPGAGDIPLRPQVVYSTPHSRHDFPPRPIDGNSYYDERERPKQQPPTDTSEKRY